MRLRNCVCCCGVQVTFAPNCRRPRPRVAAERPLSNMLVKLNGMDAAVQVKWRFCSSSRVSLGGGWWMPPGSSEADGGAADDSSNDVETISAAGVRLGALTCAPKHTQLAAERTGGVWAKALSPARCLLRSLKNTPVQYLASSRTWGVRGKGPSPSCAAGLRESCAALGVNYVVDKHAGRKHQTCTLSVVASSNLQWEHVWLEQLHHSHKEKHTEHVTTTSPHFLRSMILAHKSSSAWRASSACCVCAAGSSATHATAWST